MVGESTASLGNLCHCLNIEEPQLFTCKKSRPGGESYERTSGRFGDVSVFQYFCKKSKICEF